MTTARKAVTLLLSYLIFTKPLTEQHVTGLLLISMAFLLKMVPDIKPSSIRHFSMISAPKFYKSVSNSTLDAHPHPPLSVPVSPDENKEDQDSPLV